MVGFILGYRKHGKKWITDTIRISFAFLVIAIILFGLFNLISEEIKIVSQYNQCSDGSICLIKFFFGKLIKLSIILFLIKILVSYIKFISKERRYKTYM